MKNRILISTLMASVMTTVSFAQPIPVDVSANKAPAVEPIEEMGPIEFDEAVLVAANTTKKKSSKASRTKKKSAKSGAPTDSSSVVRKTVKMDSELEKVLDLAKDKEYAAASMRLYQMSLSPKYSDRRLQIKYLLGLMLFQLKLNQSAAFQFVNVIKEGDPRYLKPSLEKLSIAADFLGDDTMLNYAIAKVNIDDFPKIHRDMLYYRIGEFQMRNQKLKESIESFSRVRRDSPYYSKALYLLGLAYSENQEPKKAVEAYDRLVEFRDPQGITDSPRVAAAIGKARAQYQNKDWDGAIESYRSIPRDTPFWHDTLFESSWAMLRSGRFRSALSNFHSLHSSYYEDMYQPEALLLRSIVYLYICKYDEMDKVLTLFQKIYEPLNDQIADFLDIVTDPNVYFSEAVKAIKTAKEEDLEERAKIQHKIPFIVANKIVREGDFQKNYEYIKKLIEEKKRIEAMSSSWRASGIGRYALKVVETRIKRARETAGRQVRRHMIRMKSELVELIGQKGFIEYEMINGRKEGIKKKIAKKTITTQVDEDSSRDYYIQNGYEYWPFRGEFWLDELGNYHYMGTQSCE